MADTTTQNSPLIRFPFNDFAGALGFLVAVLGVVIVSRFIPGLKKVV